MLNAAVHSALNDIEGWIADVDRDHFDAFVKPSKSAPDRGGESSAGRKEGMRIIVRSCGG